jgi:leucyl aminopeptidase
MNLHVINQPLSSVAADVLILLQFEGTAVAQELDSAVDGGLGEAIAAGDFPGEFGQSLLFYTGGRLAARKVLLFGLGNEQRLDVRRLRKAAGRAGRLARESGAKSVAFAVPTLGAIDQRLAGQMIAEGAVHALFRFEKLKTDGKVEPTVEQVLLVGGAEVEAGAKLGLAVAEGTNLARSVNWLPGNRLTATDLAVRAEAVCGELEIEVAIYDRQGCKDLGLGLLLSVNQGSVEEPRFIVMRYKGGGGKGPWLGLVGKGVVFDTGGLSIKPTENMWDMKYDMSGAGAVLGAMQAIGQLKPACDILAIICATDNMPDGGALKPGDVITGLSGKSVEIRSTDAEGRLVLGDGVAYGAQQGCARMITVATLTGAVRIALGEPRYGIVANDAAWEEEVFAAGEAAGEPGWRLPHDEEYYDLLTSPIADMTNGTIGRQAGTVSGGLFIMKHALGVPCVHLDIAAQAWRSSVDKYEETGATGVGVKTLVGTALRFAERKG